MLLVHIGNLHRLPYFNRAGIGLLQAHDKSEERGLARAVGADYAHYARRRQHEGQVLEQELIPVRLGNPLEINDFVPEAGSVGDVDLQILLPLLGISGSQFLVGTQTRLALGMAGLGGHPRPLELVLQGLPALALLLLFHCQASGLLLQPG